MTNPEALTVHHTISNLARGGMPALTDGIDQTREYLAEVGAEGGLAYTPLVRSRLYAQICLKAATGNFSNEQDGSLLFGSVEQPFAPTVPEAWQRFLDRAGTMPLPERLTRFGKNILTQRGVMPPAAKSQKSMGRIAQIAAGPDFFATAYPGTPEGLEDVTENTSYPWAVHIYPDLVEKLRAPVGALPGFLRHWGVTVFSFNPYDAERASQSGETKLPPWESYLAPFAVNGLIRRLTVSLNRRDLPAAIGEDAMKRTEALALELTSDNARPSRLGPLPEQIAAIVEYQPANKPLDIMLNGDLSGLTPEQVRNAFLNLDELVADAQSKS